MRKHGPIVICTILIAVFAVVAGPYARAEYIPGFGTDRKYFYSSDMSLVEVTFGFQGYYRNEKYHWLFNSNVNIGARSYDKPIHGKTLTVKIPRAYLYRPGMQYNTWLFEKVPDKIFIHHLMLLFTHPDGEPYRSFVKRARGKATVVKGRSIPDRRVATMNATIRIVRRDLDAYNLDYYRSPEDKRGRKFEKYQGQYDGFRRYDWGGVETYYGGMGALIRKASCYRRPTNAVAGAWCTYYIVLSKRLHAQVYFMDFRSNGGRAVAEARLRSWRKIVCKYLPCDPLLEISTDAKK